MDGSWDYVGFWSSQLEQSENDYGLFLMKGDIPKRGIVKGLIYNEKGWSEFVGGKSESNISFTQKIKSGEKRHYEGTMNEYTGKCFRGGWNQGNVKNWHKREDTGIFTLMERDEVYEIKDHIARMHLERSICELELKAKRN